MSFLFDVSIIILTYNSEYSKLLSSVKSALQQTSVIFEIIISDDGSEIDNLSEIEKFFIDNDFYNFNLIKNQKNIGIVKNAYNAVLKSSGRFVFLNSPGDYIFDNKTMSDFVNFATSMNAEICFGDYISYYLDKDGNVCFNTNNDLPNNVELFGKKIKKYKNDFLVGRGLGILGASYFRSRDFTLNSLKFIERYSKYTEDTTSTAYALLENIPVYYYNRKIVWYEQGCGISTNGNKKWLSIINQDILRTYKGLLIKYPYCRALKAGIYYYENENCPHFLLKLLLKFPIISTKKLYHRKSIKRKVIISADDVDRLNKLCNQKR